MKKNITFRTIIIKDEAVEIKLINNIPTKKSIENACKLAGLHISKGNSKIGMIANISLTPGVSCSRMACQTCHIGRGVNGEKFLPCYACKAYKQYKGTRKAWDENTELVLCDLDLFSVLMDLYLTYYENSKACMACGNRFRIHAAGDFITRAYYLAWYDLAVKHFTIRFLAFTKQYSIVGDVSNNPVNFAVIPSEGWGLKSELIGCVKSIVIDHLPEAEQVKIRNSIRLFMCPGSCKNCDSCWNAVINETNVGFKSH